MKIISIFAKRKREMIDLPFLTPNQVEQDLAKRVKRVRREKKLTQQQLSENAGVPIATLRRFEQTGKISLHALLQIAYALDVLSEWNNLFAQPVWASMDDMLNAKR